MHKIMNIFIFYSLHITSQITPNQQSGSRLNTLQCVITAHKLNGNIITMPNLQAVTEQF